MKTNMKTVLMVLVSLSAFSAPGLSQTSNSGAEELDVKTEAAYQAVISNILHDISLLKNTHASLAHMQSPQSHEYNVVWQLAGGAEQASKINPRHPEYGPDGYWYKITFYQHTWQGAAVFKPIELGDLKIWFDYGHDGNTEVISEIAKIIKKHQQDYCKKHPC